MIAWLKRVMFPGGLILGGNEMVVLLRERGRIKMSVPPLWYAGETVLVLKRRIAKTAGIGGIQIDEDSATFVLEYDADEISERNVFLLLDEHLTPLLSEEARPQVELLAVQRRKNRIRTWLYKGGNAAVLGYLIKIHWGRLWRWIGNPLRYWAPLASVGFLIWVHRKIATRGLGVTPT